LQLSEDHQQAGLQVVVVEEELVADQEEVVKAVVCQFLDP
jgi:hypothetical protein